MHTTRSVAHAREFLHLEGRAQGPHRDEVDFQANPLGIGHSQACLEFAQQQPPLARAKGWTLMRQNSLARCLPLREVRQLQGRHSNCLSRLLVRFARRAMLLAFVAVGEAHQPR